MWQRRLSDEMSECSTCYCRMHGLEDETDKGVARILLQQTSRRCKGINKCHGVEDVEEWKVVQE